MPIEDPIAGPVRRAVLANIDSLSLTSEAHEIVEERITSMIGDAHRTFGARTDEGAAEEFQQAVEQLGSKIAAEVERIHSLSDDPFPEVDADQVRRSMGLICPTRPFCTRE
jgi:hypothetical protein